MSSPSGHETIRDGQRLVFALEPLEQRIMLQADWTFMVYMGGDNNLEQAAIDDFLEMAHVGSTGDVHIVVQMDRVAGYDTSYDNWTDTRRGEVNNSDVPDTGWKARRESRMVTSFATPAPTFFTVSEMTNAFCIRVAVCWISFSFGGTGGVGRLMVTSW